MSKQNKTAEEKAYHELVARLGCVVCRNNGDGWVPASVHHIRENAGMGQKNPHHLVLPLCQDHHQDGGAGVAIHASEQRFEMLYGSEMALLNQTIADVVQELQYRGTI